MKISLSDILQRPITYKAQQAPQSLLEKIISYYTTQSKRKSLYHALIVNLIIPLVLLISIWLFLFGGLDLFLTSKDSTTPPSTQTEHIAAPLHVPNPLETEIFQSLENIFSGASTVSGDTQD